MITSLANLHHSYLIENTTFPVYFPAWMFSGASITMTASPSVISEPGARVKMAFSGLVSDPSQLSGAKHWTVVSAVLAKVSLLLSEMVVSS
ncbi:Uncharacterised protein [Listeria monocytogenes]|nr:Uncharacterised protein [Listeria monocytogenes]